jgi:paraquat-inducible protein A
VSQLNKWFLSVILLLVLVLFVFACYAPLFTLSKFYIFNNTVSLASALGDLWREQQYALFLLIFIFSVTFPLVKIGLLFYLQFSSRISQSRHKKLITGLDIVGKWSMLDVFIVALLLVAIKLGPLADVTVHYGVYLFASAIILMMLMSPLVIKRRDL